MLIEKRIRIENIMWKHLFSRYHLGNKSGSQLVAIFQSFTRYFKTIQRNRYCILKTNGNSDSIKKFDARLAFSDCEPREKT